VRTELGDEPEALLTYQVDLLAGEILYHLRTTLEYVAYNLAWLDRGRPTKRTYFPMDLTESAWRHRAADLKKQMSSEHIEALHEYQPFAGCDWTLRLKSWSNDDRHNFLLGAAREYTVAFSPQEAEPDPDNPSRVRMRLTPEPPKFTLPAGEAVAVALEDLCVKVAGVVDRFQGDFSEADVLTVRRSNE
jgi:hypothetical protein